MQKSPVTSLAKLFALRGRERLFRLVWGVTCWMAFSLTLLAVAVFADWLIDKFAETPLWVRVPLTLLQVVAYALAAYLLIVRSLTRGPSLISLAKRVEEKIPEFDHRLITSIQLTTEDAQTQGMSAELIESVTDEAERISGKHELVDLADTRRLKWSLALIAWPLALLSFMLLFFGPSLFFVLLQRQLLANVEIPRDIHLKTATKKNPWPSGDEVTLHYEITSTDGKLDTTMKGKVYVSAEGQDEAVYELIWDDQTEFNKNKAIFKSKVPHSSKNFKYRARLGDGRTKGFENVVFEPRPIVAIDGAWVEMPAYVPKKPDGSHYEIEQDKGDIKAYNGSRGRVRISAQKRIAEAKLILYKRGDDGFAEVEAAEVEMNLLDSVTLPDGTKRYPAESEMFDLRLGRTTPRYVAYRVMVKDDNKFTNADNPRRTIDILEPELPHVQFLPERFSDPGVELREDDVLEGMPIPLGGSIKIEYFYRSAIGARETTPQKPAARMAFRVNEGDWKFLLLSEVPENPASGEYDIMKASFSNLEYQKTTLKNRVEFHAKPSRQPGAMARLEGGGTFDFQTERLRKIDLNGKDAELEIGDKIEFYLEVFDCDPAAGRQPGRTDPRIKEIQTKEEVRKRAIDTINSEHRIRDLEKRQQGVFQRPKS